MLFIMLLVANRQLLNKGPFIDPKTEQSHGASMCMQINANVGRPRPTQRATIMNSRMNEK